MKTKKNPLKTMVASILLVTFFNFAIISIVALIMGGMYFNGADYALKKNGTKYDDSLFEGIVFKENYVELAESEAQSIQDVLELTVGQEKDASAPTSGLMAVWLTSYIARQVGEVFIISLIEGIIIGYIVAFLFTKRPKGFELLKGYLTILVLSIILICLSGILINSIAGPYSFIKGISFWELLPELDLVVIAIIMISICFLFLLLSRSILDNMNKKIARKKIFKDDDLDIF